MVVRHPCRDKRLSLAAAVPGFVLLQAFHKTFSAWRRLHYFSGLLRYCLDFAASPPCSVSLWLSKGRSFPTRTNTGLAVHKTCTPPGLQAWNLRQPEQGLELFLRRACELRRLKQSGRIRHPCSLAGVHKRAIKWASAGLRKLFDSYSMLQSQVAPCACEDISV